MLTGIFTPNLVPFLDDGRINEGELRRMINWLIEKGVSGLYPNGSTGEFIRLSLEERKRVIQIVVEENRGRVPILAGAAEPNMDLILEVCRAYADLGCAAVSVTGPYYFKVSQESIEHFFRELAKRSPIDIVLYNIPQFSNEISVPVVTRLALDCPRIVGIKDSSRDFPRFLNTLHAVKPQRPGFSCLIGCEEILFPALLMGADGGTIASSGVVPEVIMKLHHEFMTGNLAEARRIQFKLLDLINVMLTGTNFRRVSAPACLCAASPSAPADNYSRPRSSPTWRKFAANLPVSSPIAVSLKPPPPVAAPGWKKQPPRVSPTPGTRIRRKGLKWIRSSAKSWRNFARPNERRKCNGDRRQPLGAGLGGNSILGPYGSDSGSRDEGGECSLARHRNHGQ